MAAAGSGPLPLSGQAVAFLRRGALLLGELSVVSGGPFLYRLPLSTPRTIPDEGIPEASLAQMSLTAAGPQHQQPQMQAQQRDTGPLTNLVAPPVFRHANDAPIPQQHPHEERETQALLVRALQQLLGVGAESLQLLDVDGEVRHFSVLYEQLNFKW